MRYHIEQIRLKCLKRLSILKALAGNHWGSSKENLITVYQATIQSVINYGSAFYNSASQSYISWKSYSLKH